MMASDRRVSHQPTETSVSLWHCKKVILQRTSTCNACIVDAAMADLGNRATACRQYALRGAGRRCSRLAGKYVGAGQKMTARPNR